MSDVLTPRVAEEPFSFPWPEDEAKMLVRNHQ